MLGRTEALAWRAAAWVVEGIVWAAEILETRRMRKGAP